MSAGVSAGNLGCFFHNQLTVHVVRHRFLNGDDIVEQAEFQRLTNVTYAIHSLLDLTEKSWLAAKTLNKNANVPVYCHYAKRTYAPMIDQPQSPNRLVIFLSIIITPLLNLPIFFASFIIKIIRYIQPEKNPGTTCGGFILPVLGAVALKKPISQI